MSWSVLEGDCIEAMRAMGEASVDAVVCDPPYGLSAEPDIAEVLRHWLAGDDYQHRGGGFMGKSWDSFVPGPAMWREALRVLKPGGHMLSFFGTRTYDMGVIAIRLAGFEIRDEIAWLAGSGFPKSLDVSKAIDAQAGAVREVVGDKLDRPGYHLHPGEAAGEAYGSGVNGHTADERLRAAQITAPATPDAERWQGWGTALKPAHEPIVVARKPLAGTVAANVLAHGTGALNVDGCRIGTEEIAAHGGGQNAPGTRTFGMGAGIPALEPGANPHVGRWPANVVLDPEAAAMLDEQTGELGISAGGSRGATRGLSFGMGAIDEPQGFGDSGGASRFFFVTKPCKSAIIGGCATANIAGQTSSPQSQSAASARSDAATSGSREVTPSSDSKARSTNATPSESSPKSGSGTQPTPSIGVESSPESQPARHTATITPASGAGPSEPTATTTTTASPSKSGGCADDATSVSTSSSTELGAADCLRFRYCAKASSAERNAGLDGFEAVEAPDFDGRPSGDFAKRMNRERPPVPKRNVHPTVKPIDLMRWLVRLVTPPDGLVLDPFTGSGTTGIAASLEGFRFVGIEREPEYAAIARARIAWWARRGQVSTEAALRAGMGEDVIAASGQSAFDLLDGAA